MTREEALKLIKANGSELANLPEEFKKDKEIVQVALLQQGGGIGGNLEYADDSLKKDKEIVLAAVWQYGYALVCADDSLSFLNSSGRSCKFQASS